MDHTFISRAMQVTSFNLKTSDFTSTNPSYKKEIQFLFTTNFFPSFDINEAIDSVDITALNSLVRKLKAINSAKFSSMHNYNLRGVGPGEVTLYYLINNAFLGGQGVKGDIIIGNKVYEVKAVNVSNGVAKGFFLGRTVGIDNIRTKIADLAREYKLGGSASEINGTIINSIKDKAPKEFDALEKEYAKVAVSEYFSDKEVIFINNSVTNLGVIESIKTISANDVQIDVVTNGTIKPKIRL